MTNQCSIGEIIKEHIKLRGFTINDIADTIDVNVKTLYDDLQHDRISAEKLLALAFHLDIDLEWLKNLLFASKKYYFQKITVKRMNIEYKEKEVWDYINRLGKDKNCGEIIKDLLIYYKSLFFILDAVLDYSFDISTYNQNGKEKCLVRKNNNTKSIQDLIPKDGLEVLKELIKHFKPDLDNCNIVFFDSENFVIEKELNHLDSESAVEKGMDFINSNNYRAAKLCFSYAIKKDNDNYLAHKCLGTAYMEVDSYSEAITEFECLFCKNPDDEFVLEQLMELYTKTNQYMKGLDIIEKLINNSLYFSDITKDDLLVRKCFFLERICDKVALKKCLNEIISSSKDHELIKNVRRMYDELN